MTIQEYLEKTVVFIGIDPETIDVNVKQKQDRIEIELTVPEEKTSQFIGGQGRNLFALQHLVRLVFRNDFPDKNIVLDINDYRVEKEQELVQEVKQAAEQVIETGQEKVYRYLNSYERYLVHSAIAEDANFKAVTTYSADVDNQRWLTICLKEHAPEIIETED